jgi:hypothetical protein
VISLRQWSQSQRLIHQVSCRIENHLGRRSYYFNLRLGSGFSQQRLRNIDLANAQLALDADDSGLTEIQGGARLHSGENRIAIVLENDGQPARRCHGRRQLASTIGKSILPDEESDPREIASGASKFPSRAKMIVTSCSRSDSRVGTSKPRSNRVVGSQGVFLGEWSATRKNRFRENSQSLRDRSSVKVATCLVPLGQ